jgi:N-methylhydantoinase A/oxoprolinase/acetone carboxylase beta subunit
VSGSPEPATRRDAWFDGAWVDTPVYDLESLQPGHRISGPAIVQAAYTTAVIPPGREFHIEEHGLGILDREN